MLTNELVELCEKVQERKAETQTTEVKAARHGCPTKLYDTLSSFSNQDGGGVIVFGLEESTGFEAAGVYDLQDLQKKVTEQCLQMEPPVRGVFTFAEFEGKEICSVEIPAIDLASRPCYYKGIGKVRGSYVRVGEADLPMTDYEIYSYEAYRSHVRAEERGVERASFAMLDGDRLGEFLKAKKKERPQFALMEEEQICEMLNVTRDGVPTLAAFMNFCIYPQGFFPQLGITAVVVPGYQIGDVSEDNMRFIDNKRIGGTIGDMVTEAMEFCKRNMKVGTIIDESTGRRIDKTEYPLNAIREAVLNALIHRDYSIHTEGTPVQINFFKDRLEIHSPGNLYGRMTVEQLGITRPDLRNPTLAVMAENLTGAENRYSGIPTIRREMQRYGLKPPVFENRRNEFVVTLYNGSEKQYPRQEEGRSASGAYSVEDQILRYCEKPRLKSEIAELLGIKTNFYVMKKYVAPLVDQGELALTLPERPQSKLQRYYTVKKR